MREIRRNQEQYNRQKYPGGDPERIYVDGEDGLPWSRMRGNTQTRQEFSAKWLGPCRITRRLSSEVYEDEREADVVKIHVDKLRPAPRGNLELQEIPEDSSSSGESSSEIFLSETELTDAEEEPQGAEERSARGQEATAVWPERDARRSQKTVTRRRTVFDTVELVPSSSRELDTYVPSPTQIIALDPERYLEEQEVERVGQEERIPKRPPTPAPPPNLETTLGSPPKPPELQPPRNRHLAAARKNNKKVKK